ncbi:hypothetical protein ULG90_19520 [Halopseudomonas pachastrellae]|nr:hypothetical protein ULG90_19520 [Halopseudomonas pachastrellae]
MPFINELLADNQQHNLREAPRTRTSRFDFEPDAIAQRLQQRILGQRRRWPRLSAAWPWSRRSWAIHAGRWGFFCCWGRPVLARPRPCG